MEDKEASRTFRALVEDADRKFSQVRDLLPYARAQGQAFQKVFKAYTKLWKFQMEKRAALVDSGLKRWEIGEIASRIGQLYFNQYMRTSDSRFLYEAYVFYEAIVRRRYFEDIEGKAKGKEFVAVRFKELRFYVRFLVVCLILERTDSIPFLFERFSSLVDDCKTKIREANFKEWKLIVQDAVRFIELNSSLKKIRSLRYSLALDVHPDSQLYVTRYHSKKVQKFTNAILTSYYSNEVKFADMTLDTFRMLQCLEWETSFLKEHPSCKYPSESTDPVPTIENSGTSSAIDMHLRAEMSDRSLPQNPRKILLFRSSVTQLLAAIAAICEELPPECIMLLYLSANKFENSFTFDSVTNGKKDVSELDDGCLLFGPKRSEGHNLLYPGDIIPFTRKPLFLIVDSDNSFAFKMLHGAERGEPAALLLSARKQTLKNLTNNMNGSQFTYFLTSPIEAFCQMIGFDQNIEDKNTVEEILVTCFSEWEVILCTSKSLDIVWAQVLSDPYLRRILLRFIFCRCALAMLRRVDDGDAYVPMCLPRLPNSVSPVSETVQSGILRLANYFHVASSFRL